MGPALPGPERPWRVVAVQAHRHGKGPTWTNTKRFICHGLGDQGENGLADDLTQRALDLVRDGGCATECFNPNSGAPHGAREFSWSAALTRELLAEQ